MPDNMSQTEAGMFSDYEAAIWPGNKPDAVFLMTKVNLACSVILKRTKVNLALSSDYAVALWPRNKPDALFHATKVHLKKVLRVQIVAMRLDYRRLQSFEVSPDKQGRRIFAICLIGERPAKMEDGRLPAKIERHTKEISSDLA